MYISCSEVVDNAEKIKDNRTDTIANQNSGASSIQKQNSDIPDGWMKVDFDQVSFLFEHISMSGNYSNELNVQTSKFKDTAFFNLDIGYGINDQVIRVKGKNVQITEMYVQNVVIIGVNSERFIERPFRVLKNWKKSTSKWLKVQPENNVFRFENHNVDTKPFTFDLDELKREIRNSLGEDWFKEFIDVKSLDEMPFVEFRSQSNYKIITLDTNSGKTFESIFVFYSPTRC